MRETRSLAGRSAFGVVQKGCGSGFLLSLLLLAGACPAADSPNLPKTRPVDEVVAAYIQALGGQATLDKIQTRQTEARRRHGPKLTYYWQRPNKVLLIQGKEKIGFDGGGGWKLSKKQRVTKLAKGSQIPLEADANPVRFAQTKQLYPEIQASAPENLDGRMADVLFAPNDLGGTKLYFDRENHLLVRIAEKGELSAYFENITDFDDYQAVDGLKLPFRITHSSSEPGAKSQQIEISKVRQNVPLRADMFAKPNVSAVTLGGKR